MATRKEEKEAARAERLRKQEEEQRALARRRRIGYVVGGLLAAAAIAAVVVVIASGGGGDDDHVEGITGDTAAGEFPARAEPLPDPPAEPLQLEDAAKKAGCTYKEEDPEGDDHTEDPVTYKAVPPHSGNHNPVAAEDGPYREAPALENLVHSLEHGRILLWYTPETPDEVVADLKAIYDEDPAHMIVAPIENMTAQAAATAWSQSLVCDEWSEDAIDAVRVFRDSYRDQGPEFVP